MKVEVNEERLEELIDVFADWLEDCHFCPFRDECFEDEATPCRELIKRLLME